MSPLIPYHVVLRNGSNSTATLKCRKDQDHLQVVLQTNRLWLSTDLRQWELRVSQWFFTFDIDIWTWHDTGNSISQNTLYLLLWL